MTWYEIILAVVLTLSAIGVIVLVMLQKGSHGGLSGAIVGGSSSLDDTYFGKNKSRSKEARLSRRTKYLTIFFFVLSLCTGLLLAFFRAGLLTE